MEQSNVGHSIGEFNAASAGGISMWRPQHLKDCLSAVTGDHGSPLLTALTRLVNEILKGNVPEFVRPILFGANLVALRKKDGGLRPIAVGEVFRRIAARCALHEVGRTVTELTCPLQLGCGVSGGIDAGIHAARAALSTTFSDHIMLKVNFANAFNCVRRDHIHESIVNYVPSLSPFFKMCYAEETHLYFGEHVSHII